MVVQVIGSRLLERLPVWLQRVQQSLIGVASVENFHVDNRPHVFAEHWHLRRVDVVASRKTIRYICLSPLKSLLFHTKEPKNDHLLAAGTPGWFTGATPHSRRRRPSVVGPFPGCARDGA